MLRLSPGFVFRTRGFPEDLQQQQDRGGGEDHLGCELSKAKTDLREKGVQQKEGGDLQYDFPHDREEQRTTAHSAGLKNADRQKVDPKKRLGKAHADDIGDPVGNDCRIGHEQADNLPGKEQEDQGRGQHDQDDQPKGIQDRALHAGAVAGAEIIADQRHHALGDPHRDVHRHHRHLVSDPDGRNGFRAEGAREVVQYRHAGYVQQVLDGAGNPDNHDGLHERTGGPERGGRHAHKGPAAADIHEDKIVKAGADIGEKGGESRAGGAHVQPAGQNEQRIQDDVQDTAGHGADARVERFSLSADLAADDNIQDRRDSAAEDGPLHIFRGRGGGVADSAEDPQQKGGTGKSEERDDSASENGAPDAEAGSPSHRFMIFRAQSPAHDAGGADPKEIVDGVKREKDRRGQGDRGGLKGIIDHPDEISVGKVVQDHDKTADDGGDSQFRHCLRDRNALKEPGPFKVVFHKEKASE